ncbi:putative disease resistance protein RGA3 [Panicum virgatum]|uniref:putative disease resistance protein RGA3 n=1 Tax=Panicum virgatum TaxID=38727 RepID=UPI0019D68BEC|nr:putative disease resistance protein RGA3 [Panicum virgatum]
MESKLLQLKHIAEKVEASNGAQYAEPVGNWTKKLKSAFYDVEDILDAIDYHRLRTEAVHRSAKSTKPVFNIDPSSRGKLSSAIDMLEKLINEGQELLSWVKLPTANSFEMTNEREYKGPFPPPAVFGRVNDVQTIRGMLHDTPAAGEPGPSTALCYSVVAIHGLPGSGKTTLAQSVFEEEKKAGYFNVIIWIHVSQKFAVKAVTSEMIEAALAPGEKCKLARNLGKLQHQLKEKLEHKKFLLVLDDVWNNKDLKKLDELLPPLRYGDSGSKILVTTRFEGVAKALGAQNLFPIPELKEDKFIEMFMHYALNGLKNSGQEFREHKIVGREIAQKLRGSPMAAKLVAGELSKNLQIDHWIRTRDSDLLKDTMGAIWWSYKQLEEHVRQCFRYCIMFPRRYPLKREELVDLWMAEGFLEAASGANNMENIGHACFNDLLSCSFIQPKEHSSDMTYFTIHDLFHDLLEDWRPDINVSRHAVSGYYRIEEGIVSEIPEPDQVRHLCIESYNETMFKEQILKLKNLRTIFMSGTTETMMTENDLGLLFKSLRKLRVVHVYYKKYKDSKVIPNFGDHLKHLRYLSLYPCDDDDDDYDYDLTLSGDFTKLYHLQMFYCSRTCVLHPSSSEEMCNLVNLRCMTFHDEDMCNLVNIPNIGRLTLLRTLGGAFTVRKASGYEIQQLEQLDKLCGTLKIKGLENVRSKEEARQAKLAKKVHLRELILQWQTDNQSSENKDVQKSKKHRISCLGAGPSTSTNQIPDPQEKVLEELCPPCLTSMLEIKGYGGSSYPSWLSEDEGLQLELIAREHGVPSIAKGIVHMQL